MMVIRIRQLDVHSAYMDTTGSGPSVVLEGGCWGNLPSQIQNQITSFHGLLRF
jgi:hypothetical protein